MSYWDDVFFAMHIANLQKEEEDRRRAFRTMAESVPRCDYAYESMCETIEKIKKKITTLEAEKTKSTEVSTHIEPDCGVTHSLVVEFVVFDYSGVHNEFYCLRCRKSLPELKSALRRDYITVQIDNEKEIPTYLDILQEEANKAYQDPTFPIKYIVPYLTNYIYDLKLDNYENSRKG